ncbi:MAG TPA: hypothetical protein VEW93_04975 [Acidimicrobiales bacterium]|nr:hypothetical protein [Acidimicrobiales bacterium]
MPDASPKNPGRPSTATRFRRLARNSLPAEVRHTLAPAVRRVEDLVGRAASANGEERIIRELLADRSVVPFCVDIAASDGRTGSNSLALYARGWAGLSVEMDGRLFRSLAARNAGFDSCRLFRGRVTPENVVSLFRAAQVPIDLGFLNLDIDSYDFFVLEQILSEYRPSLICAEINEKVPPPIRFTVQYRDDHQWDGSHCYGQSISQLEILVERHGYAIVALEYNNAMLMPREVAPKSLSAEEAYREGYLRRPDRLERFPWNADVEDVLALLPVPAAVRLEEVFAGHGSYSLTVGPGDH